MYECPAPTFITKSPVAGLYVDVDIERSSIVDTPTLTSKVLVVAEIIPMFVLYTGSVLRGYACIVAKLSLAHLNDNAPSAICILCDGLSTLFAFDET